MDGSICHSQLKTTSAANVPKVLEALDMIGLKQTVLM